MFRVTIVTQDAALADTLRPTLESGGYDALVIDPTAEIEPDPAASPEIVAVDYHQMGLHRSPFAEAWEDASLIAIVAREQVSEIDISHAFEDFLVLPLDPTEFLARVQAALWRHGHATRRNTVAAGDLVIDLANYQVFEGGRPLTLTYKEYELLRFLVTHSGQVFSRETLLNRVWGYDYYGGSRTVDVHIRRIRAKLDLGHYDYIETVRNVGYRFTQPLK